MTHAASLFFLALAVCTPLCAQSGAVFTTDKDGNVVNGNKYSKPEDVFLRVSGLPDDDYYFQVTNTSGTVLLSSDALGARCVTVTGGVITGANNHNLGSDIKKGGAGSGSAVQLAPFDTTESGQYKVWLTPKSAILAGGGYHGFVPSDSKTDNFKVEKGKPSVETTITGKKFYDSNENKTLDSGEKLISGWRVEIRKKGETDLLGFTFTDENGEYRFVVPRDGTEYDINEVAPVFDENGAVISDNGFVGDPGAVGARWLAITPRSGTTPPADTESVKGPDFGNVYLVRADTSETGKLVYSKGFWHSSNGKAVLADCPEWRDVLNTIDNPYPVGERPYNPSWPQVINDCFAADSANVSLRRNDGTVFKVGDGTFDYEFGLFSDWITSEALSHAAYMLSREMAAALLNRHCGNLTGTIYINQARVTDDLIKLLTFEELMYKLVCRLLNHPEAANTGPEAEGDALALRETILACINEIGGINTSTTGTSEEEVHIVWEPEPDPEGVPEPSDPYGDGVS